MTGGQPEIVDNARRYLHAEALQSIATNYPRPLSIATGYVNIGGLKEIAELPGPRDRAVRLLIGAMPGAGLGEDQPITEAFEARQVFDETLRRLREERDFDAFPPSRRMATLQAVDALLADDRIEVRRFTETFLHGKAYLFASAPGADAGSPRAAMVTSANLTSAGLHRNRELGMVHYQPGVVDEAVGWFNELWEHGTDIKDELRARLFPPIPDYSPQQIFLRMLHEYYGEELPEEPTAVHHLSRFQRDGYRRARRIVEKHGGALYADGVGTGKTHVGVEFIAEYAKKRGQHVLVVAPAQLRDKNWAEALDKANLPGQVISFQELAQDMQLARGDVRNPKRVLSLDKDVYRLVIVDEAHAFRSPDTTYYHALNRLLGGTEKDLVLLTATPVNNALWDLYHQIMLFARHDTAFNETLGIRDLRQFFRDSGANDPAAIAPEHVFPLIDSVTVRRDRQFLEKYYTGDTFPDGTPVRFPKPVLEERRYNLDEAYPGAFDRIVETIGGEDAGGQTHRGLTMARYQPESYRIGGSRQAASQQALAGLIRSGLLKRFESSVFAAKETTQRMLAMHDAVITACEQTGAVPSPAALRDLYREVNEGELPPETVEAVLEGDTEAIPLSDLTENYLPDVRSDREALAAMLADLKTLAGLPDPKLEQFAALLNELGAEKVAVFTTYGDTARYLRDRLSDDPSMAGGRTLGAVVGDELGSDAREQLMERFCPHSVLADDTASAPGDEFDLLIATDVISEGQNLQQAQAVISYDMPWNPQRVVQRNGRVIRLKSPHDEVYLYTLLPEPGEIDRLLRLEARLTAKIRAANASVGMESQVLEQIKDEQRIYADLKEAADALDGDPAILDKGEGGESGSFAGEEYRARLARAQVEGEIDTLREMPWGVGAAFTRHSSTPHDSLPAVVFAARDRRGKRHWRAVAADGTVIQEDLQMLRLGDPADQVREPLPAAVDLDATWSIAANDICAEHNKLLDPLERQVRLPASQRWALELLRDPALPDRPEFAEADEALQVPRDQAVQRALSAVRKDHQEGARKSLDAAEEVARIVLDTYGLRPADTESAETYPLNPEDLGVVAYQVVLPPGDRGVAGTG